MLSILLHHQPSLPECSHTVLSSPFKTNQSNLLNLLSFPCSLHLFFFTVKILCISCVHFFSSHYLGPTPVKLSSPTFHQNSCWQGPQLPRHCQKQWSTLSLRVTLWIEWCQSLSWRTLISFSKASSPGEPVLEVSWQDLLTLRCWFHLMSPTLTVGVLYIGLPPQTS